MFLVFDVGGTFIKYAVMSRQGDIAEKGKFPTPNQKGQGTEDFLSDIAGIYEKYKNAYDFEGIAMDLPGQIDVDNGIVYGGGMLPYLDRKPVADLVSSRCGCLRVSLENDGKCAALSEIWLGNASECKDACVLVFGTGIAGGIVIDRRIHRGQGMVAGEMSYLYENMTIEDIPKLQILADFFNGKNREPVEMPHMLWTMECSVSGLCRTVAKLKGMEAEDVNGELIYQWAQAGDEQVIDALERFYFGIAKHCCNLHVMLAPEVILLGGGISAQPAFFEGVEKYVKELAQIPGIYDKMKIGLCKFGNDSNMIGALYNFLQKYEGLR